MNEPVTDDIYRDSTAFQVTEPEEQKLERKKEEGKNRAGKEQIEEIIERLDERIAHWNSPAGIGVDLNDDPTLHQKKCFVAELMAEELTRERDYWRIKL